MRQQDVLALACLLPFTSAVALVDFTPRNTNLPERCDRVYNQQVPGCVNADFIGMGTTNKAKCSQACVDGLVVIQTAVQKACGGLALDAQSLIGRFLKGDVITELCPNFAVTTILPPAPPNSEPTPSSAPPSVSSTVDRPSQTSTAISSANSASPTETEASPSAIPSSIQSETPIATDANPPPAPTETTIVATQPAPSQNGGQDGLPPQLSNPDSGGGSPFDVTAGTGAASSLTLNHLVTLLVPTAAGVILLAYI
ncbi:hypothetical protein EJ05DRAFT_499590 [Pseudovirgaria hyperparasitica]|uniref:Extracellular membrane protein CFEM domain-containing protein n=1 Tax=Pseudovirgaria hyperparasitica TaxID=470096 RepID=A0A6A6W9D6_9PEZI|nr:uncharacterized protein EJ05DRAFT_499590 [Pseudovirgaria hyperparasitica]KAF2759165.1 hypothetical protein EJ05DRAFT_499590 [Pseudovirgaria hyperparasitica]